jgi:hypothetical protein
VFVETCCWCSVGLVLWVAGVEGACSLGSEKVEFDGVSGVQRILLALVKTFWHGCLP